MPPKARFALVAELAAQGVPVKQACLSLGVSGSGFYEARGRPPPARTIRQAWLTDQITAVYEASRQTYGAPESGPNSSWARAGSCPARPSPH